MTAALRGPTVIAICLVIAVLLVVAHLAHERNRDGRDFDGVDEWEDLKRALPPRSVP